MSALSSVRKTSAAANTLPFRSPFSFGQIFCLNFSAPFIIDFFADQVASALPFADFVFSNESEAETYGKKHNLGSDGKDIEAVALAVAAMPKASGVRPRTVVFTQGSKETIVAVGGKVTKYSVEVRKATCV